MAKSETETKKKGGAVWRGFLPDTDPIYTKAGWTFLMGANLKKPNASATSNDGDGDEHKGVKGV
jgi:hypothetical protein